MVRTGVRERAVRQVGVDQDAGGAGDVDRTTSDEVDRLAALAVTDDGRSPVNDRAFFMGESPFKGVGVDEDAAARAVRTSRLWAGTHHAHLGR